MFGFLAYGKVEDEAMSFLLFAEAGDIAEPGCKPFID